jgi:class 3 adenylate cyclase
VGSLLAAAEEAVAALDWDRVLDLSEDVLAVEPDNADAAELRALAERHVGRAASEAGRRQVTVLFADLVGSTPLGERLDPEVYLDVVRSYETACRPLIDRFGGHINWFAGDGLIAFFGYPNAHEDDARRAVHAALGALAALRTVSDRAAVEHRVELAARIGVHTGPVVIGGRGSGDWRQRDDAFGPTVNFAARLQAVAAPGTVVVSGVTAGLVAAAFALAPLGLHDLAGIAHQVEVHRVLRSRDDLGPADASGAVALVGRRDLLGDLVDRVERARAEPGGPGRAVVLRGEPGVGKSRLLAEMLAVAGNEDAPLQCSPHLTNRSLHPFRGALARFAGIGVDDTGPVRIAKLAALAEDLGLDADELVPYLAEALDINASGRFDPVELDALQLREAVLERVTAVVLRLGELRAPYVLAIEDMQWADTMTVELVERLVRAGPPPGLLVVSTSRSSAWPAAELPTEVVRVEPLDDDDVRRLAVAAAGGQLADEIVDEIARRSDGIPLYARQLVDALVAGPAGIGPDEIPLPLTELLQSRLDAVGAAKRVAQVAATIGRDFEMPLLRLVLESLGEQAATVDRHVERLAASHLVEADAVDSNRLRFHHALVRDAAYASQLHRDRAARHHAVADVLARLDDEGKPVDAAVTAYHYDRGGDPGRAVGRYVVAAERAGRTGAFDEALVHIERAAALMPSVPADAAPLVELGLCLARGRLATNQGGYLAPGVVDDYDRALALCAKVTEDPDVAGYVLRALFGIWSWYCTKGELDQLSEACGALERQLATTPVAGGAPALISCHGVEHFYTGRFVESRQCLEEAVAGFVTDDIADWSDWQIPNDPLAACYAFLASARFLLGDEPGALASLSDGLARCAGLRFPHGAFTHAFVRSYESWLHRARGDAESAREAAEDIVRVAERHGFVFWLIVGQMQLSATNATVAPCRAGLDALGEAIALYRSLGIGVMFHAFVLEQAEGYLTVGAVDEAGACVEDVLSSPTHAYVLADALRLRAEVAAARGRAGSAGVEADLRAALDAARTQGAVFYAGRITASYRRLVGHDPTGR